VLQLLPNTFRAKLVVVKEVRQRLLRLFAVMMMDGVEKRRCQAKRLNVISRGNANATAIASVLHCHDVWRKRGVAQKRLNDI
jgi:hypothetical protein